MDKHFALSLLMAFVATSIAFVMCLNAESVGEKLHVMDHPDNKRKRHGKATPLVGGLSIVTALVLSLLGYALVVPAAATPLMMSVLLCGAGVSLVGFADDQNPVSPLTRSLLLAIFMILAISLAPSLNAAMLNWGSFAPVSVPPLLFLGLMALACIGVVNAVNMADGQNGVVIGMVLTWLVSLLIITRDPTLHLITMLAIGPAVMVLLFNLRGRLFLGDCGTYGLSFIVGLLAMAAHAEGRLSIEMIGVWFFIPLMDCFRLVVTRVARGQSPFLGDRDHFHHRLQDKLGNQMGLVTYVGTVAATSLLVSLMPHVALLCMTVLAAFYFSFASLTDATGAAHVSEPDQRRGRSKLVALPGGRPDTTPKAREE